MGTAHDRTTQGGKYLCFTALPSPSPVWSRFRGATSIDIVLGIVSWTTLLKHLAVKFMGNCVS